MSNTAYRIEKIYVPQTRCDSRAVYFLDAIRRDRFGTYSDNITSGTLADCERALAKLQEIEQ